MIHLEVTLGYRTLGDHTWLSHTWRSLAHLEVTLGYSTLGDRTWLSHTWRSQSAIAHLEITLGRTLGGHTWLSHKVRDHLDVKFTGFCIWRDTALTDHDQSGLRFRWTEVRNTILRRSGRSTLTRPIRLKL